MDKQHAIEVLQALATDDSRKDAARLRDIYNEVEAALEAGATREKVYAALKDMGFEWETIRSFDTALYRIRKKRALVADVREQKREQIVKSTTTEKLFKKAEKLEKIPETKSKGFVFKGTKNDDDLI